MLEGHHLVGGSATRADLTTACGGLHWDTVTTDDESAYSNDTLAAK